MSLAINLTDGQNPDFLNLIRLLDDGLEARYGAVQKQYEQHDKADFIRDVIIIYKADLAVACGAFKEYDAETIELKRMFVLPEHRKQGLARMIIQQLEELARSKGYQYAVLETGVKQHEAIGLYRSIGFEVIDNYGPYVGNSNSICMRKSLTS